MAVVRGTAPWAAALLVVALLLPFVTAQTNGEGLTSARSAARPVLRVGRGVPPPPVPPPPPDHSFLPLPPLHTGTCPEGFSGPGCALCSSDAACVRSTRSAGATCSTDLAFGPSAALKSYACGLPPGGLLGSLLAPDSLLVQCNTATEECSIGFTVASNNVAVACQATGCAFTDGTANLTCSATACSCPADATCGNNGELAAWLGHSSAACSCWVLLAAAGWPLAAAVRPLAQPPARLPPSPLPSPSAALISSIAGGVSGEASLACDTGNSSCVLKVKGLPVDQIDATCKAAECLVPSAGTAAPGARPPLLGCCCCCRLFDAAAACSC